MEIRPDGTVEQRHRQFIPDLPARARQIVYAELDAGVVQGAQIAPRGRPVTAGVENMSMISDRQFAFVRLTELNHRRRLEVRLDLWKIETSRNFRRHFGRSQRTQTRQMIRAIAPAPAAFAARRFARESLSQRHHGSRRHALAGRAGDPEDAQRAVYPALLRGA